MLKFYVYFNKKKSFDVAQKFLIAGSKLGNLKCLKNIYGYFKNETCYHNLFNYEKSKKNT